LHIERQVFGGCRVEALDDGRSEDPLAQGAVTRRASPLIQPYPLSCGAAEPELVRTSGPSLGANTKSSSCRFGGLCARRRPSHTGCPVLPPSARDRGLGFREAAEVAERARLGRATHWDVCRELLKEDAAHKPPVEPPGKDPARRRTPTQVDSDRNGSRGCSWQRTRKTPGSRRPRREALARWFRRHLYEGPCDERAPDSRRRCRRWAPSAMRNPKVVSAREGPWLPCTEASPKGCDRKENGETFRLELR